MKRNHTKILSVILTAALIGSLIASPTAAGAAKKLKATSPKSVTAGKSIKIKTNMKCKFKSSNKKIATVNSKGVVKGKKVGKVKITVTAKKSKQKKILKIAVKKPCINRRTPAPKVNETQPPQSTVTQTPNVTATPPATSRPYTPKPDVPSTQKPSASPLPTSTATSKPSTPEPDVPSTQKPSASPMPTSTATPSPIKQPIGITAEFEGKIPMDKTIGDAYPCVFNVNKGSVTVKLKYTDNTERIIKPTEFSNSFGEVVEKDGKQFVETVITYENFSTTLQVEIVAVDTGIIYPYSMDVHYIGNTLKKGEEIDINNLEIKVIYTDYTSKIIDASEASIYDVWDQYDDEGTKKYVYSIAYNYCFEYNGELLHVCTLNEVYVPYE